MAAYADIFGVRTWYEQRGDGEPLVMLHPGGAGVDSRALAPNVRALSERFRTFTPERRAHGRTADVAGPITFEAMARDTIGFIENVVGGPACLGGCSDGAVVALLVALARPDLVKRLACVAGVFHRSGWAQALDPSVSPPEFLRTSYGELSPDGVDHYPVVVEKLARTHAEGPVLTVEELGRVGCRTLVMIGDDDEVTLEHAIAFYRALPNGELAVVPGTSQGLLVEKAAVCNALLLDFLTKDPVATFAPIRRAT